MIVPLIVPNKVLFKYEETHRQEKDRAAPLNFY